MLPRSLEDNEDVLASGKVAQQMIANFICPFRQDRFHIKKSHVDKTEIDAWNWEVEWPGLLEISSPASLGEEDVSRAIGST